MSSGDKDYVQTCFKHKVIPTIFGTPAFHQIEDLKRKIVANAASVPTTLGGGAHGHMGLTMTNADYANISATPYVKGLTMITKTYFYTIENGVGTVAKRESNGPSDS